MRRRAFDWVLIAVLTGTWAVFFARGIGDGLRDQRGQLRTGVSSANGPTAYPTVLWSTTLLRGDRLVEVDGRSLQGRTALTFYDRAMRVARERGEVRVSLRRGEDVLEADLGLTPSRFWWSPYLFSAALMGTALILLLRAPEWHLARRYFVASWGFAIGFAAFESHGGPSATALEPTVAYAAYAMASALTIWNLQDFSPSARRVSALERTIALVPAAFWVANYVVRYLVPYTIPVGDFVVAAPNVFLAAGVVHALTRTYRRSTMLERRQIRWLVFGFYVAMAGAVLGNTIALGSIIGVFGLRANEVFARVTMSTLGLAVPVGVLVSVIGYRWLDVDRLISATASYTVLGVAMLGLVIASVPRIATATGPWIGLDPAVAQWLLLMALVLLAIPAHLFLGPRLERQLFAERHRRLSGLDQLFGELGRCESADELWAMTSERIGALFDPQTLVIYAREADTFEPRYARGRISSPPYPADSLLVRALERHGRPLTADSSELDAFDRAALDTLGVALVVPIRAGERVLAFACLGRKGSGDIYLREEIQLFARIAARAGALLSEASAPPAEPPQVFRHDGELWTVSSRGKEFHLRDMRGLHYLATLLREPGREFAATELVQAASGLAHAHVLHDDELHVVRRQGDVGPILDAQARAAYRARVVELDEELADAERCADLARSARASAEREALLDELGSVIRAHRAGSDAERARVAVTKAIKAALAKIADAHPELGAHLATTIRRGYVCAYEPDPRASSDWEV